MQPNTFIETLPYQMMFLKAPSAENEPKSPQTSCPSEAPATINDQELR